MKIRNGLVGKYHKPSTQIIPVRYTKAYTVLQELNQNNTISTWLNQKYQIIIKIQINQTLTESKLLGGIIFTLIWCNSFQCSNYSVKQIAKVDKSGYCKLNWSQIFCFFRILLSSSYLRKQGSSQDKYMRRVDRTSKYTMSHIIIWRYFQRVYCTKIAYFIAQS